MNDETSPQNIDLVRIVSACLLGFLAGVVVVVKIAVINSNFGYIPPSQTELSFPGMFYSGLCTASLSDLPDNVLARSGNTTVTTSDLGFHQIKDPSTLKRIQTRLPIMLESECMQTFELREARKWAAENRISPDAPLDMLQSAYFQHLYSSVSVNFIEILNVVFIKKQVDGDTNIPQKMIDAHDFVYQKKKSRLLYDYFRLMGQRSRVELNRKWARSVYAQMLDRKEIRQIDAVRRSHKPSIVFFTAPRNSYKSLVEVQNQIRQRYADKVSMLVVAYSLDPVIGGQYGIDSLFTAIIYDKDGAEFVRFPDYSTVKLTKALDAVFARR